MPNTENILKLADAIEKHEVNVGFNMSAIFTVTRDYRKDMSGHNCGTVACIAGWTLAIFSQEKLERFRFEPDDYDQDDAMDSAAHILGLTEQEQTQLFVPWRYDSPFPSKEIDSAQAVRTLRHLATTGKIDFTIETNV